MAKIERIREALARPVDAEYFKTRLNEGWRLVAVHWEREVESEAPDQSQFTEDVPFGLRVAEDCLHLEDNPAERRILELMLKLMASDKSMSQIAEELNAQNLRTRTGNAWTQTAVFNMLPRLIEAAPQIWRLDSGQRKRT